MSKKLYEQPTTKVLVVRYKDCILVVSNGVNYSTNQGGAGGEDSYYSNEDDLLF